MSKFDDGVVSLECGKIQIHNIENHSSAHCKGSKPASCFSGVDKVHGNNRNPKIYSVIFIKQRDQIVTIDFFFFLINLSSLAKISKMASAKR